MNLFKYIEANEGLFLGLIFWPVVNLQMPTRAAQPSLYTMGLPYFYLISLSLLEREEVIL
jgi:hypothetical protein